MCWSRPGNSQRARECGPEHEESRLILRLFLDTKDSSASGLDGGVMLAESVGLGHGLAHWHPSGIFSMIALRAMSMWSGTDWRIGLSGARSSRIRFCWLCRHENCA